MKDHVPLPLKDIHFIIPCYRAATTLEACLKSILAQDYPSQRIGISVVENGVQEKKLKSILSSYPNVSYYFLKQKSRSLARNYLVSKIKEEFIAYIDADVVLDKNWTATCVESIKGPRVAAVGCSIYRQGNRFIDDVRRILSQSICAEHNTLETEGIGCLNTAATMIKKSCLQKVGLFDPTFTRCEDLELTYALLSAQFHLASNSKAKALVARSDSLLSYLIIRPFVTGYFQAKVLLKYNIPTFRFKDIRKAIMGILKAVPSGKLLAKTVVALIKAHTFIGSFIGKIRFRNLTKRSIPNSSLIKFLSKKGDIYALNPSLRVHLRTNDVYMIDIFSPSFLSLKGPLAMAIREAIQKKILCEETIGFFQENKILIKLERPL